MGERWWNLEHGTWAEFCADSAGSEHVLLSALKATSYKDNQRAMVVFEYIFGVLTYCREEGYAYDQTCALLGLHKLVFTKFIIGGEAGRDEAIAAFKKDILALGLFDVKQCRKSAQFFASALIRNFDAYRYALTKLPREQVNKRLLCVQTPHILPSLSEAGTMSSSSTIA